MPLTMEIIEEFMKDLDKDNSGKVDSSELLKELMSNGDADIDAVKSFIAKHDKDGDGSLDKSELLSFFNSLYA